MEMCGGGVRDEPTATEKEVANALRGLSLVNNAYPEFTLDFGDNTVIVNKNAACSDPKKFMETYYDRNKITNDNLWRVRSGDNYYVFEYLTDKNKKNVMIGPGEWRKGDLVILDDVYKYGLTFTSNRAAFSGLRMEGYFDINNCDTKDNKIFTGFITLPCFRCDESDDCIKAKYGEDEYDVLLQTNAGSYAYFDSEDARIVGDIASNENHLFFKFDIEKKLLYLEDFDNFRPFFTGLIYQSDKGSGDLDPNYFRLQNAEPIKKDCGTGDDNNKGDDDDDNNDDPSGSAITLSGEYSVTGSSANVTLSFNNGTMTKKAGSGTGTATSYTYKINGRKLTITQSAGGSDITNDFTLSESNGNIVVSGEQAFVFMIFGVNAETATLTRN